MGHALQPLPEKIQVNQLQKQPTVLSHLLKRASPCSQPSIPTHVRSWCCPSFGGELFPCVHLTITERTEFCHHSCTAPHRMQFLSPKDVTNTTRQDKGRIMISSLVRHTVLKRLVKGHLANLRNQNSVSQILVQELDNRSPTSLPVFPGRTLLPLQQVSPFFPLSLLFPACEGMNKSTN